MGSGFHVEELGPPVPDLSFFRFADADPIVRVPVACDTVPKDPAGDGEVTRLLEASGSAMTTCW
jgi:hypothetical protein